MARPKALFVLDSSAYEMIYGQQHRETLTTLVDFVAEPMTAPQVLENPGVLKEVEVVFTGWGGPRFDEKLLAHAPNLRAVFYGAGSIKGITSDAFWERDIKVCSAWVANGIPVAEFTLGAILLAGKRIFRYHRNTFTTHAAVAREDENGLFETTVGIISLGTIGRRVCEMLRPFDMKVLAFDPFVSAAKADELQVELVSLDDIFKRCKIVSLHTPWLKETENMIRGRHFDMMLPDSTFINTARGAVVNENEMIAALQKRQDITALLDVTFPHEPPEPTSPLWHMSNVYLTPHLAGSMGHECRRMGQYMVEEFRRYLSGQPFKYGITRQAAAKMA